MNQLNNGSGRKVEDKKKEVQGNSNNMIENETRTKKRKRYNEK